jgi:hypothetical protein
MATETRVNWKSEELLTNTAQRAMRYTRDVPAKRVAPSSEDVARLELLSGPLSDQPCDPELVLALLDDIGSPATVASTGGRFFGFVTGGVLPAALAAN